MGGIIVNLNDVTENKKANQTLLNERDKFAKIADASPGLIYSMRQNKDGSLCYPYASNAIEKIYGFTFKEIENAADKIFQLIHPDDLGCVMQSVNATKSKLVPLKCEYRYFHPKKGLVWHSVNSLPVVEPEGTVICHGIVTDITERIVADQKLIKANRLYLFISEINQMIVRTTDEETLFKEACNIAVVIGKFKMAWIGLIDFDIKELVREVHKISGVNKLHHIHVWHLNDHELHLEAHLDCSEDIKLSKFNILLDKIELVLLKKISINQTNIQPEFNKKDSKDYIVQD